MLAPEVEEPPLADVDDGEPLGDVDELGVDGVDEVPEADVPVDELPMELAP